jgi:hypothetical protein
MNPNNHISTKELKYCTDNLRKIVYFVSSNLCVKPRAVWDSLYNLGLKSDSFNMKLSILSYYSNGTVRCSSCGTTDIRTLSIDHINGGGTKHIKELHKMSKNFYNWLIENNYPPGYQVLCMNCQWVKRHENNESRHTDYDNQNS